MARARGTFSTFGGLEARDIQAWLDELARAVGSGLDPDLLFQPVLWGRSMGAAIALRAAALDSRTVALVLEAPMVDIVASTVAVSARRRLAASRYSGPARRPSGGQSWRACASIDQARCKSAPAVSLPDRDHSWHR